jgi:hypothetical protein
MQTKKEFERFFKAEIENTISSSDKPALREAWNDTIDIMTKSKELPDRARDWSHPARFYSASERPKRTLKPGKPKLKKGDIIQINGKRWFDKSAGNTYHSVEIVVNGVVKHYVPFEYGYDSAYIQTARRWLQSNYTMPKGFDENDPTWRLRDHGITVNNFVADVSRRKDL